MKYGSHCKYAQEVFLDWPKRGLAVWLLCQLCRIGWVGLCKFGSLLIYWSTVVVGMCILMVMVASWGWWGTTMGVVAQPHRWHKGYIMEVKKPPPCWYKGYNTRSNGATTSLTQGMHNRGGGTTPSLARDTKWGWWDILSLAQVTHNGSDGTTPSLAHGYGTRAAQSSITEQATNEYAMRLYWNVTTAEYMLDKPNFNQ